LKLSVFWIIWSKNYVQFRLLWKPLMCIWRKLTSCTYWKCNILSILSRKRYELCPKLILIVSPQQYFAFSLVNHGNRNCSTNDNFCLKIFCPQRYLKIILMSIVVLQITITIQSKKWIYCINILTSSQWTFLKMG
jgi:hypothetical protein